MSSRKLPSDVGILAMELYIPLSFVDQNELEELDVAEVVAEGGTTWKLDVGILAMELYIPLSFVDQNELEELDVAEVIAEGGTAWKLGKYSKGLGQSVMSFVTDREDVCSLALTAVHRLFAKNPSLSPNDIGRLDVGTESNIDRSKSVKSVLMQLFPDNTNLEGVDSVNACFGGTQALFNAINWVESSSWDGRPALVVMGDIAAYGSRAARPTGGCGALALLVGPDAPLVFEPGLRAVYMAHSYDFYKPDFGSEYPVVDGAESIKCYLTALVKCFRQYRALSEAGGQNGLNSFAGFAFHTPFCRLVQKSYALVHHVNGSPQVSDDEVLNKTTSDPTFWPTVLADSKQAFEAQTAPSLEIARLVGNMYTPSVYAALISFLINVGGEQGERMEQIEERAAYLAGKRVGLFSYGSGSAAAMFSVVLNDKGGKLKGLLGQLMPVREYLAEAGPRVKQTPKEFVDAQGARKGVFSKAGWKPTYDVSTVGPEAYYLVEVDSMYRRRYEVKRTE